MRFRLFVAAAILSVSVSLRADTLAGLTSGTLLTVNSSYIGQSFVATGSGNYTNIAFNFYTAGLLPYALGTGYMFSQAYTGTAATLSSAAAGFLGSTTASGGLYSFSASLSLTGGNKYYFYESSLLPAGAISGNAPSTDGALYSALNGSSVFNADPANSANFNVTGTPAVTAATPEPSAFILLGTGLVGVAGAMKRRYA